jgi:hypothetical protein
MGENRWLRRGCGFEAFAECGYSLQSGGPDWQGIAAAHALGALTPELTQFADQLLHRFILCHSSL